MTAQTTARASAAAHGWTVLHDTETWFNARRGDEVIDVVFSKAGAVKYGALFFNPAHPGLPATPRIMDVHSGASRQLDHVGERTPAKRARLLSWLAYAEVRAAAAHKG